MSLTSVSIRAEPVGPRTAISSRGRSSSLEQPVPHRVVDVVVDVRDAVDEPDDLPLERLRLLLAGVREDPVAHLVREVERACDPERLLVVPEAAAEALPERVVERVLARVPEGRVPGVVPEADRLDEILVQRQGARDDARDRGRLERVGHARAVVVAGGVDEDLRLPLQPAEGLRVHDPVAVALERRPDGALVLGYGAAARLERAHRERREALLEGSDPLLERRHQTMIGTVPPSALQAAPVTYEARSEARKTITAAISSGLRKAAERPPRSDLRENFLPLALLVCETTVAEPRLGRRRPRRDGVAADPVACVEVRDEPGQREHRGLRHGVVRHPRRRALAGRRGDVDDRAARLDGGSGAPRGSRARSSSR